MGPIAEVTGELFAKDRDYLELQAVGSSPSRSPSTGTSDACRLGFAAEDPDKPEDYHPRYRGARFSSLRRVPRPRRPAKLVDLLEPERIGVKLSEEFQLHPEQSTDALVLHHPRPRTSTPRSGLPRRSCRHGRPARRHRARVVRGGVGAGHGAGRLLGPADQEALVGDPSSAPRLHAATVPGPVSPAELRERLLAGMVGRLRRGPVD
jgi:hypothetical protein